jgi:hypothetical protein
MKTLRIILLAGGALALSSCSTTRVYNPETGASAVVKTSSWNANSYWGPYGYNAAPFAPVVVGAPGWWW